MSRADYPIAIMLICAVGMWHSLALAEGWIFFQESQNGVVSFDLDSVSRSGQLVKLRKRVEFKVPHKSIFSSPAYEYIAEVSLDEYDCAKQTLRTINELHILKNGSSKPAEYKMSDGMPIIGPYMEKEIAFACSAKIPTKP